MLYLEIIHLGILFLQHKCHVVNQLQAKGIFCIDFLEQWYHRNDNHHVRKQNKTLNKIKTTQ